MNLRFRLFFASQAARWGVPVGLLALVASCHHDSVEPTPVVDYFPVVVGTYRTYAVTDSVWDNARPTATTYQLRERVTEQFTDASGKAAYRLVRSKRASASAGWVDDSVFVVQPSAQAVLLTQNNLRTVELVYPARAGKGWNGNAFKFSSDTLATITSPTRFYGPSVAVPYTTPASGGQAAKTYDNTVSTKATLIGGGEDIGAYSQRGLRQVYANGVGRIVRRRFSLNTYTTNPANQEQLPTPGIIQTGIARYETLIDMGTM
jgi:hypothetical protein